MPRPLIVVAPRLLAALLTALALAVAAAQGAPFEWPEPSEIAAEPIDFEPPEPTRAVLSNGVVVYLLEDRTLPLVQGVAYVDAPGVLDPADKAGLASFTANLLREGGAGGLEPEELDERLEFLAASVEAGAGDQLASVSFSALSDTLDEVLPLWRDVLTRPGFDGARIEVERERQLEALRRVRDNPVQLAAREFFYRVAEGHPSGRQTTEASLNAIARDDLVAFHAAHYGPAVTTVAVSGDFDEAAMLERLEATLGSWTNELAPREALPPLDESPEPIIYFAPKELQQSVIIVGHPATTAYSPLYNDLDVANHILGSGFSSRLFTEIRTRRGLAYATGSQLGQGFDWPGTFLAFAFTRADATGEALGLLLEEISRLQEGGVSETELARARDTILNRSLFRFTSPAAIAERAARVELLGLEPGYYETYLENLQAITPEEVQRAAREGLRPEGMVVVVVGDEALFDRPLEDFGEVVRIELE